MSRIPLPRRPMILHALALLAPALLLPAASASVLVNEFEYSGTGTDRVELVNTRPDTTYDLSGWYLQNGVGTTFGLSGSIGPSSRAIFLTTGNLILDGGLIELYDGTLLIPHDSVPYGDTGGAPLPPSTGSFSCGRSPDAGNTGDPAADWNLDPSATFSAVNDHPPATLGMTSVFLNEGGRGGLLRSEAECDAPVVELYNHGPVPVDLTNWWLIDGYSATELFGFIPPGGYFVITDFAPGFCFEESGVLYLFNPGGFRVDQLGVRGMPLPPGNQASYQRVPDGAVPFGPYDGYDFPSSGGGSTWFVAPRTFGQTNGFVDSANEGVESSSWGTTKTRYR